MGFISGFKGLSYIIYETGARGNALRLVYNLTGKRTLHVYENVSVHYMFMRMLAYCDININASQ